MSSYEENTSAGKDKATTKAEDVDDDLKGLENQFQRAVQIATTTILNNKNVTPDTTEASTIIVEAHGTINEEAASASTKSAVVEGESDVADETVEERTSLEPILPVTLKYKVETTKTLQRIATWIRNAQRILVLSGAGVSVAAGIPDFRTPGTGLYDNLQKYNLPYAEAVFDIQYYQMNPHPFIKLASELWPDRHRPTLTHSFIALLAEKQLLLRNYTQVRCVTFSGLLIFTIGCVKMLCLLPWNQLIHMNCSSHNTEY
jgi:Sir2 family